MIRLLFAAAVELFVLSLPIHGSPFSASLRRAAGFCFVLALLPAIILGLFFPDAGGAHSSVPSVGSFVALVVLIFAAYIALRIRAALAGPKGKSTRISQKTPIDRVRQREQEFFAFLADQQQPPEDER